MLLKLENVKRNYFISKTENCLALDEVNLSFDKGEFVSIVGPSGCGKSTLLNIIAGLDTKIKGKLFIEGKNTKGYKSKDWDFYRRNNIGFIFQNFNLMDHLTALDNVEIVMNLTGIPKAERTKRAEELLDKVGLLAHKDHKPNELSGGQKQRVAIARALANDPDIILADEPTGALDKKNGIEVMELLKKVAGDKLIIMVTHNMALAKTYSDRIISMLDGKVVSEETLNSSNQKEVKNKTLNKRNKTMSFAESFKISLKNMSKKKGRMLVTVIAGSIGIAGIALVLGLSNGMEKYVDSQFNRFANSDILYVEKIKEGEAEGKKIETNVTELSAFKSIEKNKDVKEIRKSINPENTEITYNNEKIDTAMMALSNPDMLQHLKNSYKGELPTKDSVMVNTATAKSIISADGKRIDETSLDYVIGKTIKIGLPKDPSNPYNTEFVYKEFKITGLSKEFNLGISYTYYDYAGMAEWQKSISLVGPYANYYEFNQGSGNNYAEVLLDNPSHAESVYNWIGAKENGGTGEKAGISFSMPTEKEAIKEGFRAQSVAVAFKLLFSQTLQVAQVIFMTFAVVALIVSCIMTAVVLFSSVLERKTEIGVLKAVGSRNKDVMRIFQSEAVLIGLFSGVAGVILAFILQPIISSIVNKAVNLNVPSIISIPLVGMPFTDLPVPFGTIIFLVGISVIVASIAGFIPSRRATKMEVIDALRDE